MKLRNHHRGSSENDKEAFLSKDIKPLTARRKLLEKGFKKDQVLNKSRSRLGTKSIERLQPYSIKQNTTFSLYPTNQTAIIKKISAVKPLEINRSSSKSPTAIMRKKSLDSTKMSESSTNSKQRQSTEKLRNFEPPSNVNRRRVEKPTDCILKVAEQFSVKKVNVNYK